MAQLMPLPLTVSCFSKMLIGFTFWYRLTWVVLDKGPINGCVCVHVQDTSVSANAVTEVKKDLTSIRQQLHQLFATEDQLLAELATLAVTHFPELVVQYPEFHLSNAIVRLLLTDVLTLHRKG